MILFVKTSVVMLMEHVNALLDMQETIATYVILIIMYLLLTTVKIHAQVMQIVWNLD